MCEGVREGGGGKGASSCTAGSGTATPPLVSLDSLLQNEQQTVVQCNHSSRDGLLSNIQLNL